MATLLTAVTWTTTLFFFAHDFTAGLLMIPAALWISYMTTVNWQVHFSNKGLSPTTAVPVVAKGKEDWPFGSTATSGIAGESREAKKVR